MGAGGRTGGGAHGWRRWGGGLRGWRRPARVAAAQGAARAGGGVVPCMDDLQHMFSGLQHARKEACSSNSVLLEPQLHQMLHEWRAQLSLHVQQQFTYTQRIFQYSQGLKGKPWRIKDPPCPLSEQDQDLMIFFRSSNRYDDEFNKKMEKIQMILDEVLWSSPCCSPFASSPSPRPSTP